MADTARKLLVVEDDRGLQKQLKWCFDGYDVLIAEDRASALAELRRHEPPVVLQDLGLPPDAEGVTEGFATLQEILQVAPRTKVIVVTGNDNRDNALKAVGFGAYDFYRKPLDVEVLQLLVNRAFTLWGLEEQNRLLARSQSASPLEGVIAVSAGMQAVCRKIEKIAPVDVTTLLLGESGTGKEAFARALHELSPRAAHRFVAINCAAIPENLLESELFGHEKGAFTGAHKQTEGKVELADGGTLLLGESGTGKEAFARALHELSPRAAHRFVAINCAAIPENLLESELFGHEKGAFTGAHKQTEGKVELADGGTLLLDEIGDMPPALQAKLLRFLQERTVERIGGRREIPVDVRVVCATNQDLQKLIAEGRFREDLYYRISEVTVHIPPLREREGCRIVLAQHFLQRFATSMKKKLRGLSDDAVAAIDKAPWSGNVRELENRIKGAVAISDGPLITAADLGLEGGAPPPVMRLRAVRDQAEKQALLQALAAADGNLTRAASLLGVSRPTVYDLISRHEVDTEAAHG